MAEETTHQFLDRRERELTAQISALRGQLAPKEAELEQVRRLKASLIFGPGNTAPRANPLQHIIGGPADANALASLVAAPPSPTLQVTAPSRSIAELIHSHRTIKELVVQALLDSFPDGGTAVQIRNFIRDAYGRTIEPSSLRPQMHRLKVTGSLVHDTATDIWNLERTARHRYSRYDHPNSRKAMKELQDDPEGDDKS